MITRSVFEVLKMIHGSDVVFGDREVGYYFVIGDNFMNRVMEETDIIDEYRRLVELCEGSTDIIWMYLLGDDIASSICVKNLECIDSVPGLEEFILSYVGPNRYTDIDY